MPKALFCATFVVALGAPTLSQSPSPMAEVSPIAPDPYIDPAVITGDTLGNVVERIHQCEMRHIGNGVYRIAATVRYFDSTMTAPNPYSNLLIGQLDLTGAAPVWTPSPDFNALDMPGGAINQYQLSVSLDGLCCVWDNYGGTTYNTPTGPQTGSTFVCARANTATPFAVADVRAVQGVAAGGVDPHIAEPLGNGSYRFFLIDFIGLPLTGSLLRGNLDPATGVLTATATAVAYNKPPFSNYSGFLHSPCTLFDNQGVARAMFFSENAGAGYSHSWFTEDINDTGTHELVIEGTGPNSPTMANIWLNNPGHIGGTMHQCGDGGGQFIREVTLLANAAVDTSGVGSVVCWAPIQPSQAQSDYLSVVAFGPFFPVSVPIPAATAGELYIGVDVLSPILFHDRFTGVAQWNINVGSQMGVTLNCQLATLNTATGDIWLSNTAVASL